MHRGSARGLRRRGRRLADDQRCAGRSLLLRRPPTFVWTITQEGCHIAIAESGASGTVAGDTLHVEWTWNLECHRYFEWANAAVTGDAMSGEWHVLRTSSGTCFGGGNCSAPVHGVRQVR